jgi:glyoxylase-like metal-dependent hydrolase (beta-lactamase superfamily II)
MSVWRVGQASVQRVEEQLGIAHMPPDRYLPGIERALLDKHMHWLSPNHFDRQADRFVTSVHSWVVRTRKRTILVDCCAGNHKSRPWTPRFHNLETPYLARLAAVGVRPEDVDFVFCTHLHADHAGWNTMLRDGRWVPTFPNAKYLFAKHEADYWNAALNPKMASDPRAAVFADSVLPVIEARQAILVDDGFQLDDDFMIEPTPGHTPGHVAIALQSEGQRALFCGDAIHHAIQVYAPQLNHLADEDPPQAQVTRARMLTRCVDQGARLFPTHFGAPHVVDIRENAGGGLQPIFVEASYAV